MRALAHRPGGSIPWIARCVAMVAAGSALVACAHREALPSREPAYETAAVSGEPAPRNEVQVGYATWYGAALAGHMTASGVRFDPSKMTAAHRSLPFGTWVDVTRVDTGQTVRVRIIDRGPFGHEERIIDLSREAVKELGMLKTGVARVKLTIPEAPPN
jgi:peptidoglycan lytic transglycosylase